MDVFINLFPFYFNLHILSEELFMNVVKQTRKTCLLENSCSLLRDFIGFVFFLYPRLCSQRQTGRKKNEPSVIGIPLVWRHSGFNLQKERARCVKQTVKHGLSVSQTEHSIYSPLVPVSHPRVTADESRRFVTTSTLDPCPDF